MKIDTTKDLKILDPISKYIESDAKILYHYTSIDALFGGIIVKDNPKPGKEICLWATNCCYMNDPEELNTGFRMAHEVLDLPCDESVQAGIEKIKNFMHIISFSSAIDCLPMWGMYGKNGHGLALGFDSTQLGTPFKLYKCLYANEINKKLIKDEISTLSVFKGENIFLEIIENFVNIFVCYVLLLAFSKNPAYEYEHEVRCFFPEKNDIKYRLRDNLIVPYVERYIPKSSLKEIWIGPTNDMDRATNSLRNYLDYMGFNNVEIKQSKVPYRE